MFFDLTEVVIASTNDLACFFGSSRPVRTDRFLKVFETNSFISCLFHISSYLSDQYLSEMASAAVIQHS